MENTGTFLTTLDFVVFFGSLLGVMALGLWAGRNESTTKDYFLAGRNVRWWGVAGSIFGSNISANHMVGMMGVGFTLGFAESHFEITAIAGLLLLCYCFLPVYRKLNIYTLSDYLSRRYDDKSRVAYSVIMVLIITMVMMPFTYSIADGIAWGIISYTVIMIGTGRFKEIGNVMLTLTALMLMFSLGPGDQTTFEFLLE